MNRIILGAVGGLLLAAAGVFWWQGRAETERGAALPAALPAPAAAEAIPTADGAGLVGPAPPELSEVTREQRRFDRLDRNRDGRITRVEMLLPRVAAFRKLDVDRNNLLSFEEWAVATSDRFRGADRDGDQSLTRGEFLTTRPKPASRQECRCSPIRSAASARGRQPAVSADAGDEAGLDDRGLDDSGEPAE